MQYGRGILKIISEGHRSLQRPSEIPLELWKIMLKCWEEDVDDRPTMQEIELELRGLWRACNILWAQVCLLALIVWNSISSSHGRSFVVILKQGPSTKCLRLARFRSNGDSSLPAFAAAQTYPWFSRVRLDSCYVYFSWQRTGISGSLLCVSHWPAPLLSFVNFRTINISFEHSIEYLLRRFLSYYIALCLLLSSSYFCLYWMFSGCYDFACLIAISPGIHS